MLLCHPRNSRMFFSAIIIITICKKSSWAGTYSTAGVKLNWSRSLVDASVVIFFLFSSSEANVSVIIVLSYRAEKKNTLCFINTENPHQHLDLIYAPLCDVEWASLFLTGGLGLLCLAMGMANPATLAYSQITFSPTPSIPTASPPLLVSSSTSPSGAEET